MKHLDKQFAAIASILIFSIGLMLSSIVFAGKPTNRYAIGDTGPAGGIVFYVTALGYHGLEVAPVDPEAAWWGCYRTEVPGADGTALGAGEQNTEDILDRCREDDYAIAAERADNFKINGYDDWSLPSIDELIELYQSGVVVGGSYNYWSSTKTAGTLFSPDDFAEGVNWGNGGRFSDPRNVPYGIWPVRAF